MTGLYIHIPFCSKRCLYCDFFSNTDMAYKASYIEALTKEMELRNSYLQNEPVKTLYFGGGTPSQLNRVDFDKIFDSIFRNFDLSQCEEVTLEVNPDDVTPAYLRSLHTLPFNRISMGIQSFHPEDLVFLNRRHTSEQAIQAVNDCKEYGFSNISIDLIYGLPGQTTEKWHKNLEKTLRLDIPHISAYHLIYEEGTALYKLLEAGKVSPIDDTLSVSLFSHLINTLQQAGYLHYEISNFARPGYISKHNSSYWKGDKYIGLGPSAHSYNGASREWNIASLPAYINSIRMREPISEKEDLDLHTRYNDFIITRLRTMWGIDTDELDLLFGTDLLSYFHKQVTPFVKKGLLTHSDTTFTLSRNGIFISDGIMSDLLYI